MKWRYENKSRKVKHRVKSLGLQMKQNIQKYEILILKKYRFFAFIPRDSDSNFLAISPITVPDLERNSSSRKFLPSSIFFKF